jgi:hypothetical protein
METKAAKMEKPITKISEEIGAVNQMIGNIDLQNAIITQVESINKTIDLLYTRDNCLVDNKTFTIMNITQYQY